MGLIMSEKLLMWPEASYLVNHEYKFVYCPIMKAASTPLKINCMKIAGISWTEENWANADVPLRFERTKPQEAYRILKSNEYFKFAFVRNPFSRLVSAFLGVFVHNYNTELSRKTTFDIEKRFNLLHIENKKQITFRHFAAYVVVVNEHDAHWLPQHLFLGNYTKFDFIGKLENFSSDLEYINRKVGPVFDIKKSGSVGYAKKSDIGAGGDDCYYDNYSIDELIQLKERLGGYPSYKYFYPSDLMKLVAKRYLEDIKMFKYEF